MTPSIPALQTLLYMYIFKNYLFLLLAVLGLCCCGGLYFSVVEASGGSSLVAVRGLLIAVVSLVAEHGL